MALHTALPHSKWVASSLRACISAWTAWYFVAIYSIGRFWCSLHPDAFYTTDHYRDYPWIVLRIGVVEKRVLPDLIERAWRLVASKTLIKKHDHER
jgi:hypothetical protein